MTVQPSFFICMKKIKINSVRKNADLNQEISNVQTTTEFIRIQKIVNDGNIIQNQQGNLILYHFAQ